jgi:hypothetical protein
VTAEKALVEMVTKHPDTLLQIYECLHCGRFHLGNEFTKAHARNGLKKLEGQMVHPNFWTKAPKSVIEHFQVVLEKCRKRLGLPVSSPSSVVCYGEKP